MRPSETMSRPSSGSITFESTLRTSSASIAFEYGVAPPPPLMTDVISTMGPGTHNSEMVMESQTIAEIAVNVPGASRVFESHHIDYCCGGERTLKEACDRAHVAMDRVIADLD